MNLIPLKSIDDLESIKLFQAAQDIARKIPEWHKGGRYKYTVPQGENVAVNIHTTDMNDDYWVARTSTFKEFNAKNRAHIYHLLDKYVLGSITLLDECHTLFEKGYIEELADYKLHPFDLGDTVPGFDGMTYLAELYYNLQFPLKKRKFCNLIHVLKSQTGNSGYVISLAVDPSVIPGNPLNQSCVPARYTSIEYITFDPETSDLKWYMTTCSDAGGNVPQWLAKLTINSVVAKDVNLFLNWANTK